MFIQASLDEPGWLVLADSYFPGWKAYGRLSNLDSLDQLTETELTIHRANGNFRAVYLEPGDWTVRFKYTPMSFKLGLYASFMAVVILVLLLGWWAWGRLYRESMEDSPVKRIAKNSLAPITLALTNRLIDFVFAMVVYS